MPKTCSTRCFRYIERVLLSELEFYFGDSSQIDPLWIDFEIKALASEQRQGLFLRSQKLGRTIEKKLSSSYHDLSESFLLDRPLGDLDWKCISIHIEAQPFIDFYILAHRLFDVKQVVLKLKALGVSPQNIHLIVSGEIKESLWLTERNLDRSSPVFKGVQVIPIRLHQRAVVPVKVKRTFIIPFALIGILKILLSPFLELKKAYQFLLISQFVWLKRGGELISFLLYLINSTRLLFHSARYIFGVSQRWTIPAYFKTRHVLLMTHFKSYGVVVDFYFWNERWLRAGFSFLRLGLIQIYFVVRHFLLMGLFKTYGFLFDVGVFCFYSILRVWHLTLAFGRLVWFYGSYPLFKIYWFSEFQYNKRIKKVLWTE